jgi:hypothetical protein
VIATDEFAPGLLGRQCWLELASGERITLPTELIVRGSTKAPPR